jgi:Tol biopolymer transport system component
MQADGSDARSVADLSGWHAWSPNGSQILVSQGRITIDGSPTGRSNLYVIDLESAEQPHLLLADAAIGSDPAWRPITQP